MSWELIEIGTFLEERKGRYKPDDKEIQGIKRIEKIDFSGEIFLSDKPSKTNMILIEKGDLVISGINVAKGAMAIYNENQTVKATIHYSSYIYNKDKIDIEFLSHFLKSQTFINAIREQIPGGIKTEIKPKHILPLKVYIPTNIQEQKELVKILNTKNQSVNNISTELSKQLDFVKQLRQAFLREAMQGKLVPQNPNDEPATELLVKIKAEKEQLVKEKKIKKPKPLPPITKEEIPFKIPGNWAWCRLGDLASIVRGGSPRPAGDKKYYEGNIPFLKVGDLTGYEGKYCSKHTFTIKEAGLYKTRFVEENTLMLTNSGATLGVPRICTFPTTFNDGIAAFLGIDEMNKEFLFYFLREKSDHFLQEASRGQGQPNLNTDIISFTIIGLPPLTEQKRIVAKLDKLMGYCDQLEESIKNSQTQNEMLLQQVLREALEPFTNKFPADKPKEKEVVV